MNEILFPNFNIKLNIDNIAFKILGIDIYWYAIFIVIAFVIALVCCKRDDKKYNINFENILELIIILIPISFISARIYFVLFKLDYYMQNPTEILNFRNGGIAIYGGLIGATITIIFYCKIKKINTLDILDYIVPYLPLRTSYTVDGVTFLMVKLME